MNPQDIIQELASPEMPELPFKRALNNDEVHKMIKYFTGDFYSKVDDFGRIFLYKQLRLTPSKYFITPEDLAKLN